MQPSSMILLEGTLSFAIPIALAVRELFALNRPSAQPPRWREPLAAPPPAPLPAPARMPQKVRLLEDA